MEDQKQTVRAVERALDILSLFTGEMEMSLTEIAVRTDLHKSTVFRLLASLEGKGFLVRNAETDKYRLGFRIWELAANLSQADDPATLLQPEMERLRDFIGETVSLYVRDGTERIRIQAVQSNQAIRRVAPIGARLPLKVGASSKVLIAFAEPDVQAEVLAALEWSGKAEREQFIRQLDDIRHNGFATSVEEREPGAAAIAAPIFNRGHKLIAALAVSGPSNRFTLDKMKGHAAYIITAANRMGENDSLAKALQHFEEGMPVDITLQTQYVRYTISPDGKNKEFTDLRNGRNLVVDGFCGRLVDLDRNEHTPVSVDYRAPFLEIAYTNGVHAVIEVAEHEGYLTFQLQSVSSDAFYSISIVDIEVEPDDDRDCSFVASCLAMTLGTRMEEYPGQNRKLYAEAFPHIGLTGTRRSRNPAKAAVIGAPEPKLRDIMKTVIEEIPDGELPKSKTGGPYGRDVELGKCTYTIISSPVTPDNVEEVIAAMKKFGIKQANLHQGAMYRQGDFHVNEKYYPGGIEQFKQVIKRFHKEGMIVGLHSYTFFLSHADHQSIYTTPVPHKDLDTLEQFTLAADLDEAAEELIVEEALAGLDLTTGFLKQNTLILWIGDELIRFKGVSDSAPYTFTECERGAFGTTVSAHKKGTPVRRLKSYFGGYLAPKKHSELFYEIARNTAEFYNECEFDAFYLDAIDGVFILDGNDFSWYHAMAFINEMYNHLKRPTVFDCCYGPQYPSTWFARTRFGALDSPHRAYNDFNDVHVEYNARTAERMYLIPQLGWISLYPGKGDLIGWQDQLMTIEELEYMCVKHLAMDACQCYHGTVMRYKELPILERYAEVIQQYDELRESGRLPLDDRTRQLLRASGAEFQLDTEGDRPVLREAKTVKYRAESFEEGRNTFDAVNPFGEQKPFIRIEPLWTAELYGSPEAQVLLELDEDEQLALNRTYTFQEPIDTRGKRGIGVWLYGDGQGETVNIRLRSDLWVGAGYADHFIKVDYTGWRYFSFYESQNGERDRSDWPRTELEYKVYEDVKTFYASYTHAVDYSKINYIDILTSGQGEYDLKMKPIVALPHREQALVNPTVTINGQSVTFQTVLRSGTYLECSEDGECRVYDVLGNIVETPAAAGDIPTVQAGHNSLTITSSEQSPYLKRAAVTLRLVGNAVV